MKLIAYQLINDSVELMSEPVVYSDGNSDRGI